MAFHIAVANRKGGVGKSTVSVALAQAFATWGGKRVLLFDLDSQCNASLILIGGEQWRDAHREGRTIGNYFEDLFDGLNPHPKDYLLHAVGDVVRDDKRAPVLSLLPGSLLLEDVQNELILRQARQSTSPQVVQDRVRGRIEMLLRKFEGAFDIVILDCAPGLSAASAAALKMASKIIVPFRPDYVSQFAVDRIASLIEGRNGPASLSQVPLNSRRYACLANFVRDNGRDRIVIETIAYDHPILNTMLPQSPALADAFDFIGEKMTMNEKYGADVAAIRKLYDEVRQRFGL